jgi:hypothetical protein
VKFGRHNENTKEAAMKNLIPFPIYWRDLRGMIFLTSQAIATGYIIYVVFFGLW